MCVLSVRVIKLHILPSHMWCHTLGNTGSGGLESGESLESGEVRNTDVLIESTDCLEHRINNQ